MKYEIVKEFKNERFRQITGVNIVTFNAMLETLKEAYVETHRKRGRHRKLALEDMLLLTLEYYKEYRSFDCIGASYGISKSNVHNIVNWVENVLIKCGLFRLDGTKTLINPDTELEIILVDTTEIPIERPKRKQRQYYSGKKNDTQ